PDDPRPAAAGHAPAPDPARPGHGHDRRRRDVPGRRVLPVRARRRVRRLSPSGPAIAAAEVGSDRGIAFNAADEYRPANGDGPRRPRIQGAPPGPDAPSRCGGPSLRPAELVGIDQGWGDELESAPWSAGTPRTR